MIAIETKNKPVGVRKVPWITMSPGSRTRHVCVFVCVWKNLRVSITKSVKEVLPTNDGKKGRSHEECVQNAHNGGNGDLVIGLGYETDDDVEHGRNTCDDDGSCAGDFEDELESTWHEKTGSEAGERGSYQYKSISKLPDQVGIPVVTITVFPHYI